MHESGSNTVTNIHMEKKRLASKRNDLYFPARLKKMNAVNDPNNNISNLMDSLAIVGIANSDGDPNMLRMMAHTITK